MIDERLFIDSDVILDVLLNREPFVKESQIILGKAEENRIHGCTSSLILANCYYIVAHNKNETTARKGLSKLRSILTVLPFTDKEIGEALNSGFKDLEDGIQHYIALNNGVHTIITRNKRDFKISYIKVMSPVEYLAVPGVD